VYRKLSDKEFLRLIFTAEDRLRMDYIEEVKVRRLAAVPPDPSKASFHHATGRQ
jgi:hypothetical protein